MATAPYTSPLAQALAPDLLQRFLRYVRIDTQSRRERERSPSTPGQLELGRLLVAELQQAGLKDAELDEHGYVIATLPSSHTTSAPVVGLISHLDTSPDAPGAGVEPIVHTCYTIDGSELGELQDETFSAVEAILTIHGVDVHPGQATGKLVNALRLAARIVAALPAGRLTPATTSGREGFIHPYELSGSPGLARLRAIVRDFDEELLAEHVALLERTAREVVEEEPRARLELEVRRQYRNMRSYLESTPYVTAAAARSAPRASSRCALRSAWRRRGRGPSASAGPSRLQPVHDRQASLASLDGEIMAAAEATVPATDEGLLRGDGAFEVVRVYAGRPFALEQHLARLQRSAVSLRLPLDLGAVRADAHRLLAHAGPAAGHELLRIVLTRGGRRVLLTEPLPPGVERIRLGSVTYSPTRVLDGVKSLSYAGNMLAGRLARERGFDEALLLTPHGRVLEAPTSSIFWVKDERILTPPLDEHILASITRALVIELTGAQERTCTLADLTAAEEAFLASTTREVQPVAAVDEHVFGPASPATGQAAAALRAHIRSELAPA